MGRLLNQGKIKIAQQTVSAGVRSRFYSPKEATLLKTTLSYLVKLFYLPPNFCQAQPQLPFKARVGAEAELGKSLEADKTVLGGQAFQKGQK